MGDNFVQNIIQKLFGRGDADRGASILDGPLERSTVFDENFESWKQSDRATENLSKISNLFWNVKRKLVQSASVFTYSSPQANGFYFNTKIGIDPEEFHFILDFYRDRTIELGYSLYSSGTKFTEVPAGIQRIDKHYLKPLNNALNAEERIDQKYGNVLFELYYLNEEVQYLKCMVSVYSDRKYSKAQPFESYAEKVLVPD